MPLVVLVSAPLLLLAGVAIYHTPPPVGHHPNVSDIGYVGVDFSSTEQPYLYVTDNTNVAFSFPDLAKMLIPESPLNGTASAVEYLHTNSATPQEIDTAIPVLDMPTANLSFPGLSITAFPVPSPTAREPSAPPRPNSSLTAPRPAAGPGAARARSGPAGRAARLERLLAAVLRRSDADDAAFARRRRLAERFTVDATAHLRRLSPLLRNASLLFAGSAFEGTRSGDGTDFDTFVVLDGVLLRPFRLRRCANGRLEARLRPGVGRDALRRRLPELDAMVSADGRLDARRFKRWAFDRLRAALRWAAGRHRTLRADVYESRGAVGVNLTAPDGGRVEVDYAPVVAAVQAADELRPASLRPCGAALPSVAAWNLYSDVDLAPPEPAADDDARFRLQQDVQQLERDLLAAVPVLRDVTRLLKAVKLRRRWHERYHLLSYALKHVVFWTYERTCGRTAWRRDRLLPATVASLRLLERGVRRGHVDCFFCRPPAHSVLPKLQGQPAAARRLADEVRAAADTLQRGSLQSVRDLFQL